MCRHFCRLHTPEIKHLKGKELLRAHSNLCRLAAAQDDMAYELRCIRDFLAEALKQKDADAEGRARVRQLYCYYNYDKPDSILFYLPETLKSLKKNRMWEYYYNAWSVLVERYIYEEKLQTALVEARKMYADAHAVNSNYWGFPHTILVASTKLWAAFVKRKNP